MFAIRVQKLRIHFQSLLQIKRVHIQNFGKIHRTFNSSQDRGEFVDFSNTFGNHFNVFVVAEVRFGEHDSVSKGNLFD